MAEESAAATAEAKKQQFRIQKVFVKDVSFETPRSTEIFTEQGQWNPDVKVQLNTCLLYTSPSPRDLSTSRMPSSA